MIFERKAKKSELIELGLKIHDINAHLSALDTSLSSLRNTVNRKLGGGRNEDLNKTSQTRGTFREKVIEAFGGQAPIEFSETSINTDELDD